MKPGYRPGMDHQQFMRGMHVIKQEPLDQSSTKPDLPMDMTLTPQRDAIYHAREQHVSPNSPNGFDPNQQRDRIQHHPMFQAQVPTSPGHRMLPYTQPIYPHSPHSRPSEEGGSTKRKQALPLPHPPTPTPPSHHHSPRPQSPDFDDDMSDMPMNKEDLIMDNLLGMGKDWRSPNVVSDHRLQPRSGAGHQRARREFVPDEKKDTSYWCKRLKNNDSARRSRVKRKALEKLMESRLLELQKENIELRHEMAAMERRYNAKRSSSTAGEEDGESLDTTPTPPSRGQEEVGHMTSHATPSPGREEKFSREEELESVSAGSDDSRSNDDSRMYSVGSESALHRSLRLSSRERPDSMLSTSTSFASISSVSSLAALPSSTPSSRPTSRTSVEGNGIRLDKSGALDLTSDNIHRSTPARDSPDDFRSRHFSGMSGDSASLEDAAAAMRSMKNFPLKCRWKREMQSAHGSPGEERRDCQ